VPAQRAEEWQQGTSYARAIARRVQTYGPSAQMLCRYDRMKFQQRRVERKWKSVEKACHVVVAKPNEPEFKERVFQRSTPVPPPATHYANLFQANIRERSTACVLKQVWGGNV